MNVKTYRTAKGTELPLLNLRGKQYLEVKFRLVWFREDHPDWSIETELMSVTDVSAYARATVRDETGRIIATSHKFESIQGFPDFIEKAETGAIGRALALIGYGTQFCADELDEGKRIVDAPSQAITKTTLQAKTKSSQASGSAKRDIPVSGTPFDIQEDQDADTDEDAEEGTAEANVPRQNLASEPGEYRISFGRKYKGQKIKDISKKEMESYLAWLESNAIREGTVLSHQVKLLKDAFARYHGASEEMAAH